MANRKFASAIVLGILCAIIAPIADAQTPVRDSPLPSTGTSSIRGRVFAAVTDTPIRNARVQATSDLGAVPPVFTDGEGRFVIASLVAGRYRLAIAKAGYLRINFGSQGFGGSGTPIDVPAAAGVDGIDVRLTKAAAISGRIIDGLGDPVIGMTVTADIAAPANNGQAAAITVATAQTDDLGTYRLGGLPEGTFLVSVNLVTAVDYRGETLPVQIAARSPDGRPATTSIGPKVDVTRTYYPGVIDVAQAQPITVATGEDRTPIDVVVAATPPRIMAPPPWGQETEPDVAYGRGIRGRITRADGRPLPRALVRLASSESHLGFPPITATDNDGRYEFRRLPSGPYTVIASRPGFLMREYGQRRDFAAGDVIDLRSGEWLERIDISLPLAGAIAGRLVDDGGDPIEGASVRVMLVRYESERRRLVDVSGVRPRPTDDLGQYRIYGLQPGEYIVSAAVGQMFPTMPTNLGPLFVIPADAVTDLSGYATTYVPGTPNARDAQRVAVDLSQEVLGLDFALARVPMARVAGTVFDTAGKPASGPVLMSRSGRSGFVASAPVVPHIQGDGTFEFQNVAPGEYVVQVFTGGRNPATEGDFAAAYVTVNGTDITGLVLRMSSGSTISGHVTLEGQGTPDVVRAIELTQAISLSARPVDVDRSLPIVNSADPAPIHIFSDLTFRMAGINGPRVFRLTRAPREWALKAVLLNGVDVTDTPLDFGTSEQSVSDLEVVLTDRPSEVSGRVTDAGGRGVADCGVAVFATVSSLWSQPASRFLTMVRTERDGTFRAANLPPGQYYLATVDRRLEGEWQDPDVLESLIPHATSVILYEGQKVSVNPRLSLR
jgi:hypothetical protein